MFEFIVCVGLFGAVNLLFVICGLIADYLLPYIKPLESWIDTLPLMQTEAQPQERDLTTPTKHKKYRTIHKQFTRSSQLRHIFCR